MKILTQIICSLILVSLLGWVEKKSELALFIIAVIGVIAILILCILELFGVIAF
nr:MAG TPA: hypothetical protein [Caudoviricetes sp.]